MKSILKKLKQKNILSNKGPVKSAIRSLSVTNITDLAIEIENDIRKSYPIVKSPIFSHSASTGLSGGISNCKSLSCRLSSINKLSKFAALYCDEIFIESYFSDYKDPDCWDLDSIHEYLYDDLVLIHEMSPLIEEGIIKFYSPYTNVCFTCQSEQFLGEKSANKFNYQYAKLKKFYFDSINIDCSFEDGGYWLDVDCNNPDLLHPHCYWSENTPEAIAKRPRILSKILNGETLRASKTLSKELGVHNSMAHDTASNAIHGLATSATIRTSFLTENEVHISFLNSLHGENLARNKNLIALNHLSSIVPFVDDVSNKNLIKLRKREREAFISYRSAINQAIDNFGGVSDRFTEKNAKELYADIIDPQIAYLDRKVKAAKKDLVRKPLRSMTGIVGVISFGLLTGLISPDIAAIASAIGLVNLGKETIQQVMSLGDKEDFIKSDQYYFLWKLKQKAK